MNTSLQSDSPPDEPAQFQSAGKKSRRGLIWLGSVTLFVIVVLVALPIVTARVASSWLQDNGASNASIENVDINLFTGTVRVLGLQANGGPQQRLHIGEAVVDVRWWPLASKRIHVDAVRLLDTQVDVAPDANGSWQVGGLRFSPSGQTPEPDSAPAEFDWGIGSEIIELRNVSLTYQDSVFDTDVEIHEIAIGRHFSWQAGEETELVIDMDVNDSPINLRSTLVPWGERQSISGNLRLTDHDLDDHKEVLQQLAGLEEMRGMVSMDLQVTASLDSEGVLDVLITGPLAISNVGFSRETLAFSNEQMDWQGQIDVKIPVLNNEPLVTVEGDIQLAGTGIVLGDLALEASLAGLDYNGRFDLFAAQNADQAPTFKLAAGLSGQALAVDHSQLAYELARLDSFSLNTIELDDLQRASVQQLQLAGLRLMGDLASNSPGNLPGNENSEAAAEATANNRLFSLAQLDLEQLSYEAETGVVVESVTLAEPALAIVRQAGGEIARLSELLAAFAGDARDAGEDVEAPAGEVANLEATATQQPAVVINTLQVQASNLLDFEDASVTPPVNFRLSALELTVNNINSRSTDPMSVTLTTGNNNMALEVTGDVVAFADPMSVNLLAKVSALDLPRFSPYIPGYNVDRGRLSVDSSVVISGETLDVQNSVLLEGIQLAGKAADDNAILAQGMAMPLDVALDLLRDSDDRIQLDLPVTGSLSDPEFDSADIIRTVMQNALQNAAMSYVTNALQPLGTLLFIGDLASQAAAPRFAPLAMTAGESALTEEGREYLLKISELLKQRPALQLTLCGIVTESDRQVLATRELNRLQEAAAAAAMVAAQAEAPEQPLQIQSAPPIEIPQISDGDLLELAARRTRKATDFLTDTAMIDSARLFTCREIIDNAEAAGPRVRISL